PLIGLTNGYTSGNIDSTNDITRNLIQKNGGPFCLRLPTVRPIRWQATVERLNSRCTAESMDRLLRESGASGHLRQLPLRRIRQPLPSADIVATRAGPEGHRLLESWRG